MCGSDLWCRCGSVVHVEVDLKHVEVVKHLEVVKMLIDR